MAFLLSVFIDSFFSQNDGGISPLVLFLKKILLPFVSGDLFWIRQRNRTNCCFLLNMSLCVRPLYRLVTGIMFLCCPSICVYVCACSRALNGLPLTYRLSQFFHRMMKFWCCCFCHLLTTLRHFFAKIRPYVAH